MGRIAESDSRLDDEVEGLIEGAAEGYARRIHGGDKIGIPGIVEDVMSAILEEEGEFFPMDDEAEANGFYSRTLQLAGEMDLEIPRIRMDGQQFQACSAPIETDGGG